MVVGTVEALEIDQSLAGNQLDDVLEFARVRQRVAGIDRLIHVLLLLLGRLKNLVDGVPASRRPAGCQDRFL